MQGPNPPRLSGGPCKIRLVNAHGDTCVRICEPSEVDRLVSEYAAQGWALDPRRLMVGKGWTENPSRL